MPTEAVVWRCSVKKVLWKISQNSKENTCICVSFLVKSQPGSLKLYQKRDPGKRVFLRISRNLKNTYLLQLRELKLEKASSGNLEGLKFQNFPLGANHGRTSGSH